MALDIFSAGRTERVAIMIDDLGPDAMGMHYPSYEPATKPATQPAKQSTTQPTTTPVKPPTLSIKTTMLAHSGRDIAGQVIWTSLV